MFMEKQFNIGDFHHYNEDGKDTEDKRYILACDVPTKLTISLFRFL